VGFVVDKVELVFIPSPSAFHHSADSSTLIIIDHPSSGVSTIGTIVTDVPSGLSLTPAQKKIGRKETALCWYYY
jgi:hypothetical protein